MSFQQELASWNPFNLPSLTVAAVPSSGDAAPSVPPLTIPRPDGKPVVVNFLRHCGCPFAEKTFLQERKLADEHTSTHFVAVSHSDQAATDAWLRDIGGAGKVEVIVDVDHKLYAAWGLGPSSFWHVLNPAALMTVYRTGKEEGINVRPTQSGSRWQTAGSFAVSSAGKVVWGGKAERADDILDLDAGRKAAEAA